MKMEPPEHDLIRPIDHAIDDRKRNRIVDLLAVGADLFAEYR